jgi:uncharacterized membrane protein YfcA
VYGLLLMVGTIPGGLIGARLMTHIPERPLRIAFSVLLAIAGILVIIRNLPAF